MSRESFGDISQWWANIEAWHQRLQNLPESSLEVAEVYEELSVAWEELRASQDEIAQQQEALVASYQTIEAERKRYRELFELAPEAYLVTDLYGTIQEANNQAGTLLNVAPQALIGKPLLVFIAAEDSIAFSALLGQLRERRSVCDRELQIKPCRRASLPTSLSVGTAQTPQGELIGLRWMIRDISRRKQVEQALRDANVALEERVHERTAAMALLLRESHHRMKNNFQLIASLLDLQADKSDNPQVYTILEQCQHRLQAMALIHESMYQSREPDQVDAARYLRRLASQLLEAYRGEGQPVTLTLQLDEVWMPFKTAIPCGLIINELLSNALQHAFPPESSGEIAIALQKVEKGRISLIVRDTGVGVPPGFDIHQTHSLGLQLVCLLSEQLDGTLNIERLPGTCITLTFNLPQTPASAD